MNRLTQITSPEIVLTMRKETGDRSQNGTGSRLYGSDGMTEGARIRADRIGDGSQEFTNRIRTQHSEPPTPLNNSPVSSARPSGRVTPDSCLLTPDSSARPAGRAAFTLIELLVVISIIAILMGILLPALAHFRTQGYITSTTEELGGVKAACLSYYAHFNAYPGLFSEADISNAKVTDANSNIITGTQNMLLSLMGPCYYYTGTAPYNVNPSTTYTSVTDSVTSAVFHVPYTMGGGPIDYANGSAQLNAFYVPQQGVVMPQPPSSTTALPTLYDEFPSGVPVLYWRRNPGEPGTSGVPVSATSTTAAAFYLNCNAPYYSSTSLTGRNGRVFNQTIASGSYGPSSYSTIGADALAYMVVNQSLDSTYSTTDPNIAANPVQGDFVLDSAGPDHFYGPSTNTATAASQCDDIFVFGGQ